MKIGHICEKWWKQDSGSEVKSCCKQSAGLDWWTKPCSGVLQENREPTSYACSLQYAPRKLRQAGNISHKTENTKSSDGRPHGPKRIVQTDKPSFTFCKFFAILLESTELSSTVAYGNNFSKIFLRRDEAFSDYYFWYCLKHVQH